MSRHPPCGVKCFGHLLRSGCNDEAHKDMAYKTGHEKPYYSSSWRVRQASQTGNTSAERARRCTSPGSFGKVNREATVRIHSRTMGRCLGDSSLSPLQRKESPGFCCCREQREGVLRVK